MVTMPVVYGIGASLAVLTLASRWPFRSHDLAYVFAAPGLNLVLHGCFVVSVLTRSS
jgi:hypothetical protein